MTRKRVVVSGSSAGAHLAAMACINLEQDVRPAGAVLLSGIYELEPLIGTYVNEAIKMDTSIAHRNSPVFYELSNFPNTLIAWGANETQEFILQSKYFADLLNRAGCEVTIFQMDKRNHFDIVFDIAQNSEILKKMHALVGIGG